MSASAEDYKNQGNQAAKAGDYQKASELYSRALDIDPNNPVYYSNRSNVRYQLKDYDGALQDAEGCLEANRLFGKGYVRKADALAALGQKDLALKVVEEGISVCGEGSEPLLAQRRDALSADSATDFMANIFGPDAEAKLRANPRTAKYLAEDPGLLARVRMMGSNPQMMLSMGGSDPRISECMLVCMGIDPSMMPGKDGNAAAGGAAPAYTASGPASAPTPTPASAPAAPEKSPEELEGERLKEEGNELFRAKRYDDAIAKYEAAFDAHKSIVYLNNISTALLKAGRPEEAAAKADEAYEYGREHHCNTFEELGKALMKAGSAHYALRDYERAIDYLRRSMEEYRSKQTLALLDKVQAEYDAVQKAARYNPALAAEKKDEGNRLFKDGRFEDAIQAYTDGIRAIPLDAGEYQDSNPHFADNKQTLVSLYSNRAFAFFKIGQINLTHEDCLVVLETIGDAGNVKALVRKGQVERLRRQYYLAVESYKRVLQIDPMNAEARDGMGKCYERISALQADPDGKEAEEVRNIALADEGIQKICSDPGLAEVLKQISSDPKAASVFMNDPNVSSRIEKLANAGIIRMGR